MGSDSAISVTINDNIYRLNINGQKLFPFENMVVFCSGDMQLSYEIMDEFSNTEHIIENLQIIAKQKYNNQNIDILVGTIENNHSCVYQMSPYDNFEIKRNIVDNGLLGIYTGGIKTKESFDLAYKFIEQKFSIRKIYQEVFDNISYEGIGGKLTVYRINSDGVNLFYQNTIKEKDIKYLTESLIVGDRIYGKILAGVNLEIDASNEAGTSIFTVNSSGVTIDGASLTITGGGSSSSGFLFQDTPYNGVVIGATDGLVITRTDNKVKLIANATEGIKIQKHDVGIDDWINQLYIDTEGNLSIAGNIVGGTIAIGSGESVFKADLGGIYLGASNIAYAPFSVNLNGTLTATGANIQGDIDCSSLAIAGVDVLDELGRINDDFISLTKAKVDPLVNAENLSGSTITGKIIQTAATGERIVLSTNDFSTYNSSNQKHGVVIEDDGTSYSYAMYINGSNMGGIHVDTSDSSRLWFGTNSGYKLKIYSADDMSITVPTGKTCYLEGAFNFNQASVVGLHARFG